MRRRGYPAQGRRADGIQFLAELRKGQRAANQARSRRETARRRDWDYPGIALSRAASRLLCRAASFLWMTFLSAMRSMIPAASLKTFRAPAFSPAPIALVTLLIALVNADRRLASCFRRFSPCLPAFPAPFASPTSLSPRKAATSVG